ncbi:ABC transporter ATP-binding protein [Membranihabitans marinus]|uniref:ABC transporter ATP-binding protein n=1 Tax=Membranihabitans marinus TaxID=1227546 RepID=UPI001EFF57AB|nr:ABC transporter transmembrane domain-containing protein [Membranihabitans marinus]
MSGNSKFEKGMLKKDKLITFLRVFGYIRPYIGYFIIGMVMLVLSSVLMMGFLYVAGEMANAANGESRYDIPVSQYGWIFLVLLVLQGLFSYFRVVTMAIVSENGMGNLRTKLFDKIATLNYSYFESVRIGELTSRMTNDIEKLQSTFSVTLAEFLRQIVTLVVGIGVLAWLAPKLSLIMLMSLPIVIIIAVVFGRYIRKLSKERQDKLAETNTVVEEVLQNFQIVKSFTNEYLESIRFSKSIGEVVKISIRFAKWRGLFFMFVITLLFGAIFFVLWQGALLVETGEMKLGDLFSFIMYTGMIGGAIAGLGNLTTQIISAVGATDRVFELLDMESEVPIQDEVQNFVRFNGKVRFENLSFTYPSRPEVEVLHQIDLHINPGQTVALVGASGAGKSTITSLLLQFFKHQEGHIYIDDTDITEIDLQVLRKNIAIVPQDITLFAGTIRENILYGQPLASEEEVIQAAKQANAWEFIKNFPDQLDTVVGEKGMKVSGGQRQRLAIARAILRDPSILILDEATSSLDSQSEHLVQQALNSLMVNRTSLIIAHRLSTIRNADKIYVMSKGKIIESGTHDDLIQDPAGSYSHLAKLQFESEV